MDVNASDVAGSDLQGSPLRFPATDGYALGGFLWCREQLSDQRPTVIITCATSVRSRYYARFAAYLFQNGFNVLTYDYRGIGESRPQSLRGFAADWIDWGEKDLEGALRYVETRFPGAPVSVVGHSIGGFAIGAAPSNAAIERILTVGAQFAYWRDYAPQARLAMLWKWHVLMPLVTQLLGYFPAKRLGWMEDTPAGVAMGWSRMGPRFETSLRRRPLGADRRPEGMALPPRFAQVRAPILAIGLSDDAYGTVPAIRRLLSYFPRTRRLHLHLGPEDFGQAQIGHFAFFHDRFRDSLWPIALSWLKQGEVMPKLHHSLEEIPPA
ncbi:alpha/beta fold hydrolase [Rhizobium sp. SSA_523]|uniref:alpha/beta hydrolase family protein n=1 Tax=Rhizobium sp. SSA_523 TaxID=2952477 RepID=UPI002090C499|nr:alpha/beta fold hydrolase [Rhizobium sp. SSA_523]MCO5734476.1 alpha/beta fold hydrolase [Rhizobium sp. SSA_523]WKC23275.1 alpha/beta fold hydrolase [Rhizobium sp. SSA_523]